MATTVGRIVLDVDADGRLLERRIRKIGKSAGEVAGRDFSKAFQSETSKIADNVSKRMQARFKKEAGSVGKAMGITLTQEFEKRLQSRLRKSSEILADALFDREGFAKFVGGFANVDAALDNLNQQLKAAKKNGVVTENQLRSIIITLRSWSEEIRKVEAAQAQQAEEERKANEKRLADQRAIQMQLRNDLAESIDARERAAAEQVRIQRDIRFQLIEELELYEQQQAAIRRKQERFAGLNRLAKDFGARIGSATRNFISLNGESESFFKRWKELPRGFRRFAFFTGLFSALASEIAILGSAAGSSLAVVAGSLQQLLSAAAGGATIALGALANLGVGVGVLIAAFQGFGGELSELPPKTREFAAAVRKLGPIFGDLRKELQERVFANLTEPFNEVVNNLLPNFQEGVLLVSDALNGVFADGLARLSTPEAAENIRAIFDGVAQSLGPLFSAIFNLTGALANVWIVAQPFVLEFVEYLDDITNTFLEFTGSVEGQNAIADWFQRAQETLSGFLDGILALGGAFGNIFDAGREQIDKFNAAVLDLVTRFEEWTGSLEGQNALQEWFANGERIIGAIIPLAVALGEGLNALVNDRTITLFENLINELVEFTPALTDILLVLAEADIFGLIAIALNEIGQAIQPIIPVLSEFATLFAETLGETLRVLGPALGDVLAAFAPLIPLLAGPLSDAITTLAPIVGEFAGVLAEVLADAVESLIPVILPLLDVIIALAPVLVPLLELLGNLAVLVLQVAIDPIVIALQALAEVIEFLVPFLQPVLDFFADLAGPFLSDLTTKVTDSGSAVGSFFEDFLAGAETFRLAIEPVFTFIGDLFRGIGETVANLWETNVRPVFDFISGGFQAIGDTLSFIFEGFISPIITNIGLLFVGLWQTFVKPALDQIGAAFTFVYEAVIKPVADFVIAVVESIGTAIRALWETFVQPAIDAIADAFRFLSDEVIGPIGETIGETVGQIGDTIGDVFGTIGDTIRGAFDGVVDFIRDVINGVVDIINTAIDGVNAFGSGLGGAIGDALGVNFSPLSRLPRAATGGIVTQRTIAGEAGPEIIIPLSRPLSQVDPSVRELAAIAQGMYGMAGRFDGPRSTGTGGAYIAPGAIQVVAPYANPRNVAVSVLDELAQELA